MKRWHWITLGVLTLVSIALQMFGPENPHAHVWDAIPGFYAVYGFTGCVVIIFVSKALGKGWLQKREDYYND
jgi:hypothetical protein